MIRWQYLRVRSDSPPTAEQMDELGERGWELVSMYAETGHLGGTRVHIGYFKRDLDAALRLAGARE